jgi:periplasmic mercuric ion binding protein
MRLLTTLTVCCFLFIAGIHMTGCSTATDVHATEAVIQTPSLQCDMCTSKVTKALQAVDGVESVDVNLENKTASISYDPNAVTEMELMAAITNVGYQANDQQADAEAYEKLDACCKMPE